MRKGRKSIIVTVLDAEEPDEVPHRESTQTTTVALPHGAISECGFLFLPGNEVRQTLRWNSTSPLTRRGSSAPPCSE